MAPAAPGGLGAYVVGNFVGLNLEFLGHELRMAGAWVILGRCGSPEDMAADNADMDMDIRHPR